MKGGEDLEELPSSQDEEVGWFGDITDSILQHKFLHCQQSKCKPIHFLFTSNTLYTLILIPYTVLSLQQSTAQHTKRNESIVVDNNASSRILLIAGLSVLCLGNVLGWWLWLQYRDAKVSPLTHSMKSSGHSYQHSQSLSSFQHLDTMEAAIPNQQHRASPNEEVSVNKKSATIASPPTTTNQPFMRYLSIAISASFNSSDASRNRPADIDSIIKRNHALMVQDRLANAQFIKLLFILNIHIMLIYIYFLLIYLQHSLLFMQYYQRTNHVWKDEFMQPLSVDLQRDVLVLLAYPVIVYLLLSIINLRCILCCYIAFSMNFIATTITMKGYSAAFIEVVCVLLLMVALRRCQLYKVEAFLQQRKYQAMLQYLHGNSSNNITTCNGVLDKNAEANKSFLETKSVLGRVAHDLWTPLSSFITLIEMLQKSIDDFYVKKQGGELTLESLMRTMSSMQDSVSNIRTTNNFLVMTLNRCIDLSRYQSGMALSPKYETIDLMDCLRLPLTCMCNIQGKMTIKLDLKAVNNGEDLCSHIITDKQWLQENILCLLSNAVKHSVGSEVVVRIFLEKIPKSSPDSILAIDHYLQVMRRKKLNQTQIPGVDADVPKKAPPIFGGSSMFMATTGMALDVISEKELFDTFLRIEVEDSGPGLSEYELMHMFQSSQQKQRLGEDGSGLGLYSLSLRLDAMQGKYGVNRRSDAYTGTVFWFSFPYREDEDVANCDKSEVSSLSQTTKHVEKSNGKEERKSKEEEVSTPPPRLVALAESAADIDLEPVAASKEKLSLVPTINRESTEQTLATDDKEHKSSPVVKSGLSSPLAPGILPPSLASKKWQPDKAPSPSLLGPSSYNPSVDIFGIGSAGFGGGGGFGSMGFGDFGMGEYGGEGGAGLGLGLGGFGGGGGYNMMLLQILVVDDSPAILKMTSMLLSRLGHQVTTSDNSIEVIPMLEKRWKESKFKFDLILMDCQMPEMDGFETTKLIRSIAKEHPETMSSFPYQLVVGMTATTDADLMSKAYGVEMDGMICKPFNIETFKSTIAPFFSNMF